MIRIAAFGDCHVGVDSCGRLAPHLEPVNEHADVLLIAGDLTKCGTKDEARILADEVQNVTIPIYAVLGNHDHHADEVDGVTRALGDGGIACARWVGGGGRDRRRVARHRRDQGLRRRVRRSERQRIRRARDEGVHGTHQAHRGSLERRSASLSTDHRVALLHYAPIDATLVGERLEIYPFLGSYLLAEAIDVAGADLVLHGHAHGGTERGSTPGGVPVRNVAQPVIGAAYKVYTLGP